MTNLIILYIIISYFIVLGYAIASIHCEGFKWYNKSDRVILILIILLSPFLLFILLGSLLYKKIKE